MSDIMNRKRLPVASLKRVVRAISRKAKTARQIADEVGLSKPAVYALLRTLKALGFRFQTEMVRDGATGPEAKAFRVLKAVDL